MRKILILASLAVIGCNKDNVVRCVECTYPTLSPTHEPFKKLFCSDSLPDGTEIEDVYGQHVVSMQDTFLVIDCVYVD